jgi:predicted NAD/FAD-dependent oxidoreductase
MDGQIDSEPLYDMIVVGSGIAGLHVAVEMLRGHPRARVAVLEKYKALGGRTSTFRQEGSAGKPALQWESGAGRFSTQHTRLLGLLKRYGLTFVPIGSKVVYKGSAATPLEDSVFESGLPVFMDSLARLPADDLARHTVRQLLEKIHGPKLAGDYLVRYPYRAELETMRADLALEFFRGELGTQEGFGICKEGLGALVEKMVAHIERLGGSVHRNHELVGVEKGETRQPLRLQLRIGSPKEGAARPLVELRAARVVLAVEAAALSEIPGLPLWGGLKHLKMTPLLRMYAVFPREGGGGPLWTEAADAGAGARIVTAGHVRYLIPAGGDAVQISYTDSQDADYWKAIIDEKGETAAGTQAVEELRQLLRADIPSPSLIKTHYWRHGVTNWLPGSYDPRELSQAALRPFAQEMPALHFCGESFSLRQGWIEGAIEHADALLKMIGSRAGPKNASSNKKQK